MSTDRPLSDREIDRLLSGRQVDDEPLLSGFVASVAACAPAEAPTPSPALAALLEAGLPVTAPAAPLRRTAAPPRSARARQWARRALVGRAVAVGGALSLSAVLAGAVAGALPAPAQDGVADLVRWVTQLELPRSEEPTGPSTPAGGDAEDRDPAPAPTSSPTPTGTPGATRSAAPDPAGGDHPGGPAPHVTTAPSPEDEETLEPDVDVTQDPDSDPTDEPTDEPVDEPVDEEQTDEEPETSGLLPIRLP